MMKNKLIQPIGGITLIESLLVLAIATTILLMGIRLANTFNRDKDVSIAKDNIKQLFDAASDYYQANCLKNPVTNAYVFPLNATAPAAVNWTTDFGLSNTALIFSSLIDNNDDNGYLVQFNPRMIQRQVQIDVNTKQTIGNIQLWTIQVSAKLNQDRTSSDGNTAALRDLAQLQANCFTKIKSVESGKTILLTCAEAADIQSDTSLNYIAWQKLPGTVQGEAGSTYRWFMPLVKQFNELFTNSSPEYLLNNDQQENYLCHS